MSGAGSQLLPLDASLLLLGVASRAASTQVHPFRRHTSRLPCENSTETHTFDPIGLLDEAELCHRASNHPWQIYRSGDLCPFRAQGTNLFLDSFPSAISSLPASRCRYISLPRQSFLAALRLAFADGQRSSRQKVHSCDRCPTAYLIVLKTAVRIYMSSWTLKLETLPRIHIGVVIFGMRRTTRSRA